LRNSFCSLQLVKPDHQLGGGLRFKRRGRRSPFC
jgi:hypothetical protein